MVTGYRLPDVAAVDGVDELRAAFEWQIPTEYNIAGEGLQWAETDARRTALHHVDEQGDAHEFSYGELSAASERLAATLRTNGVSTGDRVALCAPQSPEALSLHLAAYRLGAVTVPISVLLGDDSVRHLVETSGARELWLDSVAADRFADVLDRLDVSATTFELGATDYDGPDRALGGLRAETDTERDESLAGTAPDDAAIFVSTSGTSGRSKLVVQSHQYLIGSLVGYQLWFELFGDEHAERVWTPSSWAWAGALFDVVFPTLAMGGTVCSRVRRSGFDPRIALDHIERAGASRLFLPPTALRKIRAGTDPTRFDLSTLDVVLSGGEFLASDLKAWGEATLDVTINVGYGLTEANALIGHCRALYPDRGDSIGVPYPGHEVLIVDENGETVSVGDTGEIALRTPDPVLFKGYWTGDSVEAVPDGPLFYTGDRGYRDADGYVYYAGRSDDVIITSGYRVGPREVERTLEADSAVREAIVGGVPDEERGERIVAYVVPATDDPGAIDTEALGRRARDSLGKYKAPHEIHVLSDPAQTHSGKIDRSELFDR